MRTLVIGLPLPRAEFDNYTFLSAPSFGEYSRLIVDMASVSNTVDDVIHGTGVHSTYGGQAIVNGEASAHAFSLREALTMRRREAEWVLSHGGLVVLFAYPEVVHEVGGARWPSYSWLPEPEGFTYAGGLLAGFGRPGAVLVQPGHVFAPYITQFAPKLAYRAYVNEDALPDGATIVARSSGGVAIAAEVPAGGGTLVIMPPLVKPEADRQLTATVFAECFERLGAGEGDPISRHPLEAGKEVS
jgi:hypothetical protein